MAPLWGAVGDRYGRQTVSLLNQCLIVLFFFMIVYKFYLGFRYMNQITYNCFFSCLVPFML